MSRTPSSRNWRRELAAPLRVLLSAAVAALLAWVLTSEQLMPVGATGQIAATAGLFVFVVCLVEGVRLLLVSARSER